MFIDYARIIVKAGDGDRDSPLNPLSLKERGLHVVKGVS